MKSSTTFIQQLKNAGHRITKSRMAIITFMTNSKLPVPASRVLQSLQQQDGRLNRTTVYRELNFLVQQNIVRPIQFIGQSALYELAQDHHHHLVCTSCHTVKEVAMPNHLAQQEKRIYQKEKFTVTAHALEFYGLCQRCGKTQAQPIDQ
jgi:Fe2+ or Zn2+ uptake regulation protein